MQVVSTGLTPPGYKMEGDGMFSSGIPTVLSLSSPDDITLTSCFSLILIILVILITRYLPINTAPQVLVYWSRE